MSRYDDNSSNPYYRATIEELFEDGVVHVSVGENERSSTGLYAFGYPEKTYGYKTFTAIAPDDVPRLVAMAEERDWQSWERKPEDKTWPWYAVVGAKWWTDFLQSYQQVSE